MPINKVEMSLDEIIKANKSENKGNGKASGRGNKSLQGTKRRQISKQSVKNRAPKGRTAKTAFKGAKGGAANKVVSAATKQLVQKLVKKALAQSNAGRNRTVGMPRNAQLGGKTRGGRIVKKTVVLNRLKMNPRSKVIARRRIVPQNVSVRRQRPIQYQQTYTLQQPVVRRVNYVPNNARRPVIVRSQPRTIIVQQRQPARRANNFGRSSIRQHINQMRQSYVVAAPRVQMPRQQQQQVRVVRQTQFVPARQQRGRQQRNNNFGNRGQRKVQYDPMFEPPNFLQRIPSQNAAGGRRFVQY